MISAVRQKSKFEFKTFLKKKKQQIFGFPWCSIREDLFIDVSITYRTDIDEAKVISAVRQKSKFEFRIFEKKINFGFPWSSTREDLSIYV